LALNVFLGDGMAVIKRNMVNAADITTLVKYIKAFLSYPCRFYISSWLQVINLCVKLTTKSCLITTILEAAETLHTNCTRSFSASRKHSITNVTRIPCPSRLLLA
jgi:hypothetical protein